MSVITKVKKLRWYADITEDEAYHFVTLWEAMKKIDDEENEVNRLPLDIEKVE